MELPVDERVEDGEWRWRMMQPILSAIFDVYIVLFTFLTHFWLYLQSDPCLHDLWVLALMWNISLQTFV